MRRQNGQKNNQLFNVELNSVDLSTGPDSRFVRSAVEVIAHRWDLHINDGFRNVFDALQQGDHSILITGSGGVGKSRLIFLIQEAVSDNSLIAKVAPTGVAALNIRGKTIHDFFGISSETGAIKRTPEQDSLIRSLQLLVIDEISMVRPDLLDTMDEILKSIRNVDLPFGGVRLVLVGDPWQLPPVIKTEELPRLISQYGKNPKFYHAHGVSDLTSTDKLVHVELTDTFRQQDSDFIKALLAIRNGDENAVREACRYLNANCYKGGDSIRGAITLAFRRDTVEGINQRLIAHAVAEGTFQSILSGLFTEPLEYVALYNRDMLPQSELPCPDKIVPYVGLPIMMTKNDPRGRWVNGSLGKIVSCHHDTIELQFLRESDKRLYLIGREKFSTQYNRHTYWIEQFPLVPVYATTIHKSQSATFTEVNVTFGEEGAPDKRKMPLTLLYTAASRAKSPEGLRFLEPLEPDRFIRDPAPDLDNFYSRCIHFG